MCIVSTTLKDHDSICAVEVHEQQRPLLNSYIKRISLSNYDMPIGSIFLIHVILDQSSRSLDAHFLHLPHCSVDLVSNFLCHFSWHIGQFSIDHGFTTHELFDSSILMFNCLVPM